MRPEFIVLNNSGEDYTKYKKYIRIEICCVD